MVFVIAALVIAVILAALVSLDVGALFGLQQMEMAQTTPLVVIVVLLVASLFSRRLPLRNLLSGAIAWIAIFAVVVGAYAYRHELAGIAGRVMGDVAPQSGQISEDGQVVRFSRGMSRSFVVQTQVNSELVRMVFDTGATAVVLTFEDARQAGYDVDGMRFTVPVQTANGMGRAASVRIQSLQVGGITRKNVRAFIAEPGALDTSLLGMSFLETLESYTVSQDELELRG